MDSTEIYTEIRKLRKKLRQIENLEKAQRPLNAEEQAKIRTKHSLRSLLQEKLKFYEGSDFQKPQPTYTQEEQTPEREPEGEKVEEFVGGESTTRAPDEFVATELESSPEELPVESSQTKDIPRSERPVNAQNIGSDSVPKEVQKLTEPTGRNPEKTNQSSHVGSSDREASRVKQSKGKKTAAAGGDAPREANPWDRVKFTVTELIGHDDIICSVDCYGDTVVSGSRDTSVKIWDAVSGSELRNLGGHTDSVTAVLLVPADDCQELASHYSQKDDTVFIVSSSLDCSLKLWVLDTGEQVKSIYTFNAITCLGFIGGRHLAVAAYTGGKVELWDILKGESAYSVIGHDEAVTSLKVTGEKIVTASGDGVIKLWELRGSSLHPIFVSENVKPALPRMKVFTRKVHTAVERRGRIYYGDDGHNVKVLDWRGGVVHKLRNHKDGNDFGLVDSILVTAKSNYLLCSGYDIDLGNGYLNFFSPDGEKYLATLTDDDISRVFTLADCTASDGHTRLVTGGAELKVWDVTTSKTAKSRGKTVTSFYNQEFSRRARDSEEESGDDSSDGEDDRGRRWSEEEENDSGEKPGTSWWCDII